MESDNVQTWIPIAGMTPCHGKTTKTEWVPLSDYDTLRAERDEAVMVLEALSKFGNPYDGPSEEELTLWGRAHELITRIKGETT